MDTGSQYLYPMTKLSLDQLNRLSVDEYKAATKIPVHVVLDNVRSMNNVGSIFRTCDSFGINHIHLCGITPRPPHKDIRRTALGATDSVDWTYHESTLECLSRFRESGIPIASIEQTTNSVDLTDFAPDDRGIAIILGNEVDGVAQEVVDASDHVIEIAQYGTKHSLNISVCTGIVVHALSGAYRRR